MSNPLLAAPPPLNARRDCPACGATVGEHAATCPGCGAILALEYRLAALRHHLPRSEAATWLRTRLSTGATLWWVLAVLPLLVLPALAALIWAGRRLVWPRGQGRLQPTAVALLALLNLGLSGWAWNDIGGRVTDLLLDEWDHYFEPDAPRHHFRGAPPEVEKIGGPGAVERFLPRR